MTNYICLKQKTFDQLLSQALANCSRASRNIENYNNITLEELQRKCRNNCNETYPAKKVEYCYRKICDRLNQIKK